MEHHVLDGVRTGLKGHALGLWREAMHRAWLMQRMCLVDNGIQFFLRHVADIRLFFIGAAATRSASLDDITAGAQIGSRELAQLPRPIGALEAGVECGAW